MSSLNCAADVRLMTWASTGESPADARDRVTIKDRCDPCRTLTTPHPDPPAAYAFASPRGPAPQPLQHRSRSTRSLDTISPSRCGRPAVERPSRGPRASQAAAHDAREGCSAVKHRDASAAGAGNGCWRWHPANRRGPHLRRRRPTSYPGHRNTRSSGPQAGAWSPAMERPGRHPHLPTRADPLRARNRRRPGARHGASPACRTSTMTRSWLNIDAMACSRGRRSHEESPVAAFW